MKDRLKRAARRAVRKLDQRVPGSEQILRSLWYWLRGSNSVVDAGEDVAERVAFVRQRIKAHQDTCLEYAVWLEGVRCDLTSKQIEAIIGRPPPNAAPVLFLHSDDWLWEAGELERTVVEVLDELGLDAFGSSAFQPTARADEVIRTWAGETARERVMS